MGKVCLILFFISAVFADKVFLKTGTVVEGAIIGKSDVIIKIYVEEFQRAVAIEKENIDSIETSEGRRVSFAALQLNKSDFNPKFKVAPRMNRPINAGVERKRLFEKDVFEQTRKENADSAAMKNSRRLNRFFNVPARIGSLGIGYTYMPGLNVASEQLREFGFAYTGGDFTLKCLNAQVRRNLGGGVGTLILDIGYGKKTFTGPEISDIYEFASMRYVSMRYSLCKNRWLFSPGLSGGLMLSKAGVTHRPETGDSVIIIDVALDDHFVRPLLGLDFNFYDVVTAQINLDLWGISRGRYFAGLAFLMPFLQ